MKWRLANECGVDPSRFGDLTYPDVVALLTKGNPDRLHKEYWQAKKILADHASGLLVWQDTPIG